MTTQFEGRLTDEDLAAMLVIAGRNDQPGLKAAVIELQQSRIEIPRLTKALADSAEVARTFQRAYASTHDALRAACQAAGLPMPELQKLEGPK